MGRLRQFHTWWERASLPWRKWRIVMNVETGDEIPEDIPKYGAVVVASGGRPTWIAFDCPCGRGHRIMLNLNSSRRPLWVIRKSTPLTLSPSIDDSGGGRRCHFFLQAGKVQWAPRLRRHEP